MKHGTNYNIEGEREKEKKKDMERYIHVRTANINGIFGEYGHEVARSRLCNCNVCTTGKPKMRHIR